MFRIVNEIICWVGNKNWRSSNQWWGLPLSSYETCNSWENETAISQNKTNNQKTNIKTKTATTNQSLIWISLHKSATTDLTSTKKKSESTDFVSFYWQTTIEE